eukprot:jgi/Bigna1/91098/estExt_fgenesh1_pg.C_880066
MGSSSSTKVSPDQKEGPKGAQPGSFALPEIRDEVGTTPPMAVWPSEYLKRRVEIAKNERVLELKSGRHMSYFTEGKNAPGSVALLCLHGFGMNKFMWVQKKPMDGVFLICPDRIGYGGSSTQPKTGFSFADGVKDYVQLLDSLRVERFYVAGHSMGGSWALSLAAALGDRVLGCLSISSPCCVRHPEVDLKQMMKSVDTGMKAIITINEGCCACCKRCMVDTISSMLYHPDKTRDFGFASFYKDGMKGQDKGTAFAHSKMDNDHFFVAKILDSVLHGCVDEYQMTVDFTRVFAAEWSYNLTMIKCKTFIYNGFDEVVPLSFAQKLHELIPGSEFVAMKEDGHSTILLKFDSMVKGMLNGVAIKDTDVHTEQPNQNLTPKEDDK